MSKSGRLAAALCAVALSSVGLVTVLMSGTAGASAPTEAGATVSAAKGKSVATLTILTPGASIKKKGKTEFKPAADGAKLKVGDTVQTDGTGFVEIDYTDDSFTRLDINTTFTIISLTDDQGNRKINGSLESGQAWNRTSALTESESFEQQGAGATAAVVGTAYSFECDGAGHCVITTFDHNVRFTSVDGEIKILEPLQQCDADEVSSTDTNLCDVPTQVTPEMLSAWQLLNAFLDLQKGLPIAGFPSFGTIENGEVTSFTPVMPPHEEGAPAAPLQAPVIDPDDPLSCDYPGCDDGSLDDLAFPPGGFEPGSEIVIDEIAYTDFVINVISSPSGAWYVVFTKLPNDVGTVYLAPEDTCSAEVVGACTEIEHGDEVAPDTRYEGTTVFRFIPHSGLFDEYGEGSSGSSSWSSSAWSGGHSWSGSSSSGSSSSGSSSWSGGSWTGGSWSGSTGAGAGTGAGDGVGTAGGGYCEPDDPFKTDTMEFHAEVGPEADPVTSETEEVDVTVAEHLV